MKTLRIVLLIVCFVAPQILKAQNPIFKKNGIKVVTLSNGKYNEFHDQDTIVEIGSALFNVKTGKIVGIKSNLLESLETKVSPETISRWMCIDPMAEEYSNWSPYVYVANNPLIFIDPDGQKIILANNSSQAMTNLSMIAATSKGGQRVNALIASNNNYTAKSIFWTRNAAYDPYGERGQARTMYYPGSVWMTSIEKGAASSMYVFGHEMNHAYDHAVGRYSESRKIRENRSVHFTNYLRSVYGDEDALRTSYSHPQVNSTFSENESAYNPNNEKITNFTQTLEVSAGGSDFLGFSFDKSENGEDAKTSYMISTTTESGQFIYAIYGSKKEYDAAVDRINNLNKKEDEK